MPPHETSTSISSTVAIGYAYVSSVLALFTYVAIVYGAAQNGAPWWLPAGILSPVVWVALSLFRLQPREIRVSRRGVWCDGLWVPWTDVRRVEIGRLNSPVGRVVRIDHAQGRLNTYCVDVLREQSVLATVREAWAASGEAPVEGRRRGRVELCAPADG